MLGANDNALAIAVAGVTVFSLAELWQRTAPSLSDLRGHMPGSIDAKQRLVDADVVVGMVAVLAGAFIAIVTRDVTALILILVTFGALSLYYHATLAAPAV